MDAYTRGMLAAVFNPFAFFASDRPVDQAATGPDLPKRHGPVFIHDAVIPWQGETLLLSLLRAQALEEDDDTPDVR
ncbi:MAG: hypothetical protein AB3N11_03215 [Arenibacterium sp.]